MSKFTENVHIAPLPKENLWITTESFRFYFHLYGEGEFVEVLKDFKFDGASIPRPLWILFAPTSPKNISSAALHDWLVKYRIYGYWKTNWYFFRSLRANGNGYIVSWLYFIGVTLGCWIPYYRVKEKLKKCLTDYYIALIFEIICLSLLIYFIIWVIT